MAQGIAEGSDRLLAADEPPAVTILREDGGSPFFLTADHAGKTLPRRMGGLGLPEGELERHIAWDIGIAGTSRLLADRLDAFLILQTYSRLVIDCNRAPGVPTSIPVLSELTRIPGNEQLTAADAAARVREIFEPYHGRIVRELDARRDTGRPTVLIAMHSFTPVFKDFARPWHVGVLYNRDPRLARIMLKLLGTEGDLVVGDNEPYAISDESDYTIPVHGERRGIPHVEIEIRQDLIADAKGQAAWADRLARLLEEAYRQLGEVRP
ncbi:MAG: N-formylglutamate amidohydrolase [Proteobacteria bacterium]|nr:N-formylglutamate amidohydrolase [Pseudomonadota bacterium]MBI3495839.1 N-formylglutamate amidohydrolase [Pseudomonadota bacterium]